MLEENKVNNELNAPQEAKSPLIEEVPIVEETLPKEPTPPLPQRNKKVFIIVFVFFAIVLLFLIYFFTKRKTVDNIGEPLSSSDTVNQTSNTKPLEKDINNILYTTDGNNFIEVSLFKNLDPNSNYSQVYPYFDETNGKVYLGSQDSIIVYDLKNKEQKEIYRLSDKVLKISSFSVLGDNLYISLSTPNVTWQGYIEEFNVNSQKSRRIGPQKNVLYGGLHYLLKTSKGEDVISSTGGDGCGGYGEIRLVTVTETKLVAKTGTGCSEEPRYIASLDATDNIALMSVFDDPTEASASSKPDKLYSLNIYTGEVKNILDLKPLSNKLKQYYVDQRNHTIYLIFKDEVWSLNLNSVQIESKITLNGNVEIPEDYFPVFNDGKLYVLREEPYTDNFNMTLTVSDVTTGETTEYDWGKQYAISAQSSILGFWKNQPLINMYIYPKILP